MVLQNLNIVNEKVAESCLKAGRNPSEVKIIAVTKNTGLELIKEALDAGMRYFWESKAQELAEKYPLLGNNDIAWHFIGHLQRNKVKYIIDKSGIIHSVDSLRLAEEINTQAEKQGFVKNVLLEIKTSDEEAKYGLSSYKEIVELAAYCNEAGNLQLDGLMTVAPFTDDEKIVRKSFSKLRNLLERLNSEGFRMHELSMGMTDDYKIAIEEGSTMVRIGTALFGARDYSKSWREQ